MRLIVRLIGTMCGIWASASLISGIHVGDSATLSGHLLLLACIAVVMTLVNSIVRPLVKILAFPLYILTFGLFALVTNAVVFIAASKAATLLGLPFVVDTFGAALLGGTLTAAITAIAVAILGKEKD
ncbi:phage holin family protein [Schaalia sp. lx-100]|uniref:phage holin family protein n=1 Tax=Schaalia sp. lx-100 TaxID=2899081 RepID=UPI001E31FF70|nr:phage holin family protein [Schaalia sp. lx-100]MCD4557792.1 phage holin family protein [Schaalia sp. lx-100]